MLDTSLIDAKDNPKNSNLLESLYEGYPKNGNNRKFDEDNKDGKKYTAKTILGANWLHDLHGINNNTDENDQNNGKTS